MSVQDAIEHKLREELDPVHLEVLNESHMHNVPPGSESHFKVFVVSPAFAGQKRVGRQRLINQVLAEELANGVHALSMHTLTPEEWDAQDRETLASPKCLGGMGK
ncbi:MAG TPA: BolA/IbaG family iron-sulfur metabolism protein [Gammaproteobacteria bacterium]|nr:BolA/IbaG family iron-sulfur metabolism protein [Gammaproteobacteria bacterium]